MMLCVYMHIFPSTCLLIVPDTVYTQEEEYTTELDLRLHLHEPRLTRITQDIHNVRASKLKTSISHGVHVVYVLR